MHPDKLGEAGGGQRPGEQEVAGGEGGHAADLPGRGDLADRLDSGPGMGLGQPGDIVDDLRPAGLDPAVVAVGGLGDARRCGGIVEHPADIVQERGPIALQGQDIVAAPVEDRLGGGFLAVHRVGGDDPPLQRKEGQQLRHHRDLVGAAVDLALAQDHTLLACPGADHVQRPRSGPTIERAPGGLAVDCHHLAGLGGERGHEPAEANLEGLGVEQTEQARERVVAGNTARQRQEPTQERLLRPSERRHADAGLGTGQGRGQGDQQDLQEIVALRGSARSAKHARNRSIPPLPSRSGQPQADPDEKRFYKPLMRFPWGRPQPGSPTATWSATKAPRRPMGRPGPRVVSWSVCSSSSALSSAPRMITSAER